MRIEDYFQQLRDTIDACLMVRSFDMTYDKRGSHEGVIHGEVHFVDDSALHLREFVDVEMAVDRLTYVYQYMDPDRKLVFRYDNSGHYKKLNLPTYPHHKHEGSESQVVPSSAPDLMTVLNEIEMAIKLP